MLYTKQAILYINQVILDVKTRHKMYIKQVILYVKARHTVHETSHIEHKAIIIVHKTNHTCPTRRAYIAQRPINSTSSKSKANSDAVSREL